MQNSQEVTFTCVRKLTIMKKLPYTSRYIDQSENVLSNQCVTIYANEISNQQNSTGEQTFVEIQIRQRKKNCRIRMLLDLRNMIPTGLTNGNEVTKLNRNLKRAKVI